MITQVHLKSERKCSAENGLILDTSPFVAGLLLVDLASSVSFGSLVGVGDVTIEIIVVGVIGLVTDAVLLVHLETLMGVFTFVVFGVETVIVSIARQFGVVERLMIVSNSLHVLRSIGNLWVMWRIFIFVMLILVVKSLGMVIEFMPFVTLGSWWIHEILSTLMNGVSLVMAMVMSMLDS